VIALLALHVAFGRGGRREPLDRRGALEAIVANPFGRTLLAALAVGFAGYALWRIGRAAFPVGEDKDQPLRRVSHAASGLLYVGVSVAAVRFLTGTAGEDRLEEVDWTARAMSLPLGRAIVAAAGVAFVVAAAWSVRRAVTGRWRRSLAVGEMSKAVGRSATATGIAGLLARAVVQLLIGAFLGLAAWRHDPSEAVGLDGALKAVGDSPWGDALLAVLAAGLLARGVFSAIEARYRRT
jgi:hypothetical protein